MKILVIGGAGYIGSHVTRELLDAGHSITVFDNLSLGLEQNLFDEAEFIKGDILDAAQIDAALATGIEAVIHLAAFKAAGESMTAPEKYAHNNITGTINVLNAMTRNNVKYFVFSSSAATYGEPEYLPIDEKHPTNPENFYGFTKLEIERFLYWYEKLKGIRFAALRYFNAAGYDVKGRLTGLEKNPANLLPVIMEAACGMREKVVIFGEDYDTPDGTGVRDYVHVNDLATAHRLALDYIEKNDKSLTVNLGSDKGLSVLDILESAKKISGTEIKVEKGPRRPGDPATLYATSALAKNLLGWEAAHSDVDTLVETSWKVYRNRK